MSHFLLPLLFLLAFVVVVLAAVATVATRSSLRRHPLELAPDAPATVAEQRFPQYVTRRGAALDERGIA